MRQNERGLFDIGGSPGFAAPAPIFAPACWTIPRLALAATLSLLAAALFIVLADDFQDSFPNTYVWSDLLIGYQGGFIRRGLLGEIAFLLQPVIGADTFLTLIVAAAYVVTAVAVVALVCARFSYAGLLFLLSPAGLLFPANDPAGAYGRRDVFIIGAFLLSLAAIRFSRPTAALGFLMAIYLVAGLIHEVSWFYFPLATALLLNTSARALPVRWMLGAAAACSLYMLAALGLTVAFKGSTAQADAIASAWQAHVPAAYAERNALVSIGASASGSVKVVVESVLGLPAILGYLIAIPLAAVPVLLLLRERRPRLSADPLRLMAVFIALAGLTATFLIAADWGRFIHLALIHCFLALLLLPNLLPMPAGAARSRWGLDRASMPGALILAALYAGGWRVAHFTFNFENPLWPGRVFFWLGIPGRG